MSATDSSGGHRHVPQAQCAEMRYRDRNGETLTDIANALGWSVTTVKRHADAECSHAPDSDSVIEIQTRDHLRRVAPGNNALPAALPSEAYCRACGRRVTVGPDGTEYGHLRGNAASESRCPHRPDTVDTKGTSRWSPA